MIRPSASSRSADPDRRWRRVLVALPELADLPGEERGRVLRGAERRAAGDRRTRLLHAAQLASSVALLLAWLRFARGTGWVGYVATMASLAVVALAVEGLKARVLRDCLRLELGCYCPGCGYDLRGGNAVCPECGRPADPADPTTAAGRPTVAELAERIRAMTRRSAERGGADSPRDRGD